jgi:hypothetical protein
MKRIGIVSIATLLSVLASQPSSAQNMVAGFTNMAEQSFDVRVAAPREVVAEYALCKAVWFAEQNQAETIWLGEPAFSAPLDSDSIITPIPEDWLVLTATAYYAQQNEDFPFFDVAENAVACKGAWDWYS